MSRGAYAGGGSAIRLRKEWLEPLQGEFDAPYMRLLSDFLRAQKAEGKVIFPPGGEIFQALELTPPEAVRVVILGQDPYHGSGQAHGLSFSVREGVPIPPSLRNIHAEITRDVGVRAPAHGNLESWAKQGVLLLNTVMTVEAGQPGSHQSKGWETFTDKIIALIAASMRPTVFMLWGAQARKKAAAISRDRHCILEAPHPSPLSAHRGFLGCGHFSAANQFLAAAGRAEIDWSVPE